MTFVLTILAHLYPHLYPIRTTFYYPEYFYKICLIFARDKTNAVGHPGLPFISPNKVWFSTFRRLY